MNALGYHIRIRLNDDRVIASTPAAQRTLARVVLCQARWCCLLVFALADTHLHLLVACSRKEAGKLARRIEIQLSHQLDLSVGFTPAYIVPIRDGRHFYNTFYYILNQNRHHQLESDPLREATNLWDLLGLRVVGRYSALEVRRHLPRVKREDLLDYVGVTRLEPSDGPLEWLHDATLAAAALPTLEGTNREVIEARRALIRVIDGRLSIADQQELMRVGRRTIFRLHSGSVNQNLILAIRLQLGLLSERAESDLDEGPFLTTSNAGP